MTAWYPLVAWGIDRAGCKGICDAAGLSVGKSSCFMCPNLKPQEWLYLKATRPVHYAIACEIDTEARKAGNLPQAGRDHGPLDAWLASLSDQSGISEGGHAVLEDRCHHGGCFT
jgi:hypothetical protein